MIITNSTNNDNYDNHNNNNNNNNNDTNNNNNDNKDHWPGKEEPQKGSAQKGTLTSLKCDFKHVT